MAVAAVVSTTAFCALEKSFNDYSDRGGLVRHDLERDFGEKRAYKEPTGCPPFPVAEPRNRNGAVIKATDFGFSPTNEDNAAAINAAIAEARRVNAKSVVLAPGVYRCFGEKGVFLENFEDFVFDGRGAELIFRRKPIYPIIPSWDHDPDRASFVVRNCRRTRVGNFDMDWDWKTMPLATSARCVGFKVDNERDLASYVDFELIGHERHPLYGRTMPVQKVQGMSDDFRHFSSGAHWWAETYEGAYGFKSEWLSPTRIRVYPGVWDLSKPHWPERKDPGSAKSNRGMARNYKIGEAVRIKHCYYGKGAFSLISNEDFDLHDIRVYACFGWGLYIGGSQHRWSLRNASFMPRDWRHPCTSSADTIHFCRSRGESLLENVVVGFEDDDAVNVHDRFTVAKKVSDDTLEVILERGARYFLPGVGNQVELRLPGYGPTGWFGRVKRHEGERIVFDRPLPKENPKEGWFLVFDRTDASDKLILRNCHMDDMEMRTLINVSDVTVDSCTFRRTNGDALRMLADYTLTLWCEGMGTTNLLVKNCVFEDNLVREGIVNTPWSLGADIAICLSRPPQVEKSGLYRNYISNILVENCLFRNSLGYFADLRFGRDITFRGNVIERDGSRSRCRPTSGSVRLENVQDVRLENNVFRPLDGCEAPAVFAAPDVEGLVIRGNSIRPTNRTNAFEFSKAGYWQSPNSPRRVSSLNSGWEFSLDEFKSAKPVTLPHSIDEGEIGFEASGGVNRRQPAWYRRTLVWNGGSARQFLHFEAIMGKCRVTLNGENVAEHFGGFLPIHVEVTGKLLKGANMLEVWCDNSDDPTYPPGKSQDELDFTYFGGIYRDTYLVETGRAYVTDTDNGGVYVTSHLEKDGSWTVRADVALGGDAAETEVRLFYDGKPVVSPFKPENPALWSPESPALHNLDVKVYAKNELVDAVRVRFGIRDFTLDERGFTLNGKPYGKKLIGANRHQDYLFIGMALPNSLHWRDVKKYHDCGMEVFRNAHYPQDPAFMDACDALGMFVIVTTPGWQFWNEKNPVFEQRVYDDIAKMVRRDRSRASLLMWEPILNETRFPGRFVTNAVAVVKRESRAPNYCACDAMSEGSGICDVNYGRAKPGKAAFCREWGDFPDDWNAQNSSSRIPMDWGEVPMTVQAWHYIHETRWPSLTTMRAYETRHFGGTLWHGADHSRGYHPDNFYGGILTYGRQKKYSWYAFKAALTKKPFVYVAHELNAASPADIPVYSNCAYTATWLDKPFVPGETKYVYSEAQKYTYDWEHPENIKKAKFVVKLPDGTTFTKERARRFAKIDVALDTEGLAPVADGSDLVAVTATLADAAGTPKRYASEEIRFSAEGAAEIVGENPQRTRWGEAIVLIRPKAAANPKPITVKAELVRRGPHVKQQGSVTFTPGSARTVSSIAFEGAQDKLLREVEKQQRDYNVKEN